jgi:acyl-lipid omega-6 desaturase (Delta-12 desaturase)
MSETKEKTKARPEWQAAVKKYSKPVMKKSIGQMLNTLLPYIGIWILMIYLAESHFWVSCILAALAGLFVVRIFIIFHDCGHYNFFKNKRTCDIIGYLTGIICFTPFHDWGKDHKLHHVTCGNLDKRGFGDIWTLTVNEFKEASRWEKFRYKVYRNPFILFLVGPIFVFTIKQRFTRKHTGTNGRKSVYLCNLGLLIYFAAMISIMPFWTFFWLQFIVISVGAIAGVWLFYVQHQFEEAYWEHDEDWTLVESALEGSSFYKLPRVLQWFSGNIGFHHIHHLSSKIPNYRLEDAYNDEEIFQEIEPLTIRRSLELIHFRLWDEVNRKMVGYKAVRMQS